MDPASLALGPFSALREIYLLFKFVLRTVRFAGHHVDERQEIFNHFHFEYLYLCSFQYLLTQNDGLVDQRELNQL